MLIVFKSRCTKINLCCGFLSCDRTPQEKEEEPQEPQEPQEIQNP
tara:strand:- start:757 stop:891 length:135 start_codon:yes stop_codon:yes gene_type:complete